MQVQQTQKSIPHVSTLFQETQCTFSTKAKKLKRNGKTTVIVFDSTCYHCYNTVPTAANGKQGVFPVLLQLSWVFNIPVQVKCCVLSKNIDSVQLYKIVVALLGDRTLMISVDQVFPVAERSAVIEFPGNKLFCLNVCVNLCAVYRFCLGGQGFDGGCGMTGMGIVHHYIFL